MEIVSIDKFGFDDIVDILKVLTPLLLLLSLSFSFDFDFSFKLLIFI